MQFGLGRNQKGSTDSVFSIHPLLVLVCNPVDLFHLVSFFDVIFYFWLVIF